MNQQEMTTSVNAALQEMWARWVRGSALRKGTKRYQNEAEAYVQGALTALHASGRITTKEVDRITWAAAVQGVDVVLDPHHQIKNPPKVPRKLGTRPKSAWPAPKFETDYE